MQTLSSDEVTGNGRKPTNQTHMQMLASVQEGQGSNSKLGADGAWWIILMAAARMSKLRVVTCMVHCPIIHKAITNCTFCGSGIKKHPI